jgi:hypothetical protein
MATSSDSPVGQSHDPCAPLRTEVAGRCEGSHAAQRAYEAAAEGTRTLKRDLVAAQHRLTAAFETADARLRTAEKASAREEYLEASQRATTQEERTEATAAWARAIDRVNRTSRLAGRAVSRARQQVAQLEAALHAAERTEQTARIRADAAEAACLDARVRLAACEEGQSGQERVGPTSAIDPFGTSAGHAVTLSGAHAGGPLIIEALVSGDEAALEGTAAALVEHSDLSPAEARLQLRELVDAILSAASSEGYLTFDERHPLWANLTVEEARLVVAALARLGFQLEPAEGWHAGRAPLPADLAVALGYAGLDARHMRNLPTAEALRLLPQSIGVDGRTFLADRAPDLTVDHMVHVLERRAAQLEPLWDAWGQVRPILLAERRSLEPARDPGSPGLSRDR